MKDYYTIQEFFLTLKLGFFKEGKIENWGYVSSREITCCFLSKPFSEYQNQLYSKRQLAIGLYLLDLYLLNKSNNQNVYIMVVSVCRTTLDQKEKTYVLKLTTNHFDHDIRMMIQGGVLPRRRKSVFSRKPRRSTFDSSPINSVSRKH